MKKNIALLAGGYSGEFVISIKTAETIEKNLDTNLYNVYKIIVTKDEWYHEHGKKIQVDKNDFSLLVDGHKITFDCVFIAMHGSPGEDGRIQGYLDMMQIPYTTCNAIVSALTFNKSYCNKVVKAFNVVNIANSVHLIKGEPYSMGAVLDELKLPVFVKPNESGSSLGVSKVKNVEELLPAIEKAFGEDKQVLIEEFIEGRELTIGVYKVNGLLTALPATEILSQNEFFDYEAKYTPGVTKEITPAQIPAQVKEQLETKAMYIYRHLNCRGIVRMDFILEAKTNKLFFLEVNTMPGQSENSIVPQQVRAAGMDLKKFYGDLLEDCLRNHSL
ncbi:D-alanine--D-alanine ligase [Flavipsychrobacter stenotrophus]|uniref:D-alanine--D-alanine ligase n=1 Tax=Flavipsychrobacter stenotrophus TaxID=2077091 RepID=A0A2S7SQ29_9BACT|nr:D-alanine--D-alanine ligase [Flavipsychrobacter stenotrophus]PQJ08741.1 D-alanine--D-alanine ligase [Flavipsychrobacter stenotrophus]